MSEGHNRRGSNISVNRLGAVYIEIYEHVFENKTLYSWVLRIFDDVQYSDDFLYGTQLDAMKKANGYLYRYIQTGGD